MTIRDHLNSDCSFSCSLVFEARVPQKLNFISNEKRAFKFMLCLFVVLEQIYFISFKLYGSFFLRLTSSICSLIFLTNDSCLILIIFERVLLIIDFSSDSL